MHEGATHLGDIWEVWPYGPAGLPRLVYAEQLALQPDEGHLLMQPSPGTILQQCTDFSQSNICQGPPLPAIPVSNVGKGKLLMAHKWWQGDLTYKAKQ